MHRFNERHPAFAGFSEFYFQVIGPRLRQKDSVRIAEVRRTYLIYPIIFFLALIVILGVWDFNLSLEHTAGILILVIAPAFLLPGVIGNEIKVSTRYSVIGGFCRFKNWIYHPDWSFMGGKKDLYGLSNFVALGLVPRFGHALLEGHISGKKGSTNFEFFRATLIKTKRIKNFTRQFITLGFERKFHGRTIVCPDKGIFNTREKDEMKRVRLVDPVFEKMFEVYGTDQVEARYLLSPDFMQRLVDLEHCFKGSNIRFGFIENQLLIAIDTRMRLGAGSMFKPLDDPERMQKVLDIMAAIYDVIDGVIKPVQEVRYEPAYRTAI